MTNKLMNSEIITGVNLAIMYLEGKKYLVEVNLGYNADFVPDHAYVTIEPTDEEVQYDRPYTDGYYKFGGFPEFIQTPVSPCAESDGKPYAYICTVRNDWGDAGNANVFALIRNGTVVDTFVEASCY